MVKKPDSHWSLPVLINAGEASLGFQIGANATETIYMLMDDATPRLLFNDRFNIGVDAKAVAGPKAAEARSNNREILARPCSSTRKRAASTPARPSRPATLSRNDKANFMLYNTKYTLPELLYSDWVSRPPSSPR